MTSKKIGAADYSPAGRPATAHGQGFVGELPNLGARSRIALPA